MMLAHFNVNVQKLGEFLNDGNEVFNRASSDDHLQILPRAHHMQTDHCFCHHLEKSIKFNFRIP